MSSLVDLESERISYSMSLRYSALNLKKSYGTPPDIRRYVAHTENELRIQAFNTVAHIPQGLKNNYDAANWIENNPELNPRKVIGFLTSPAGRDILTIIASKTCREGAQNFVERLRDILTATGGMTIIGDAKTESEPLTSVLHEFAKALVGLQNNGRECVQEDDIAAVEQLCKCVLVLNEAIIQGNESASLQQFFAGVRSVSSGANGLLAPRQLTDIYNTLKANGPYMFEPKEDLFPAFLMTSSLWTASAQVSLDSLDPAAKTRWCVLTRSALYMFADESSPWPSECLPLGWVRCCMGERGDGTSCVELQSRGGSCPVLPLIHINALASSSLSYHSSAMLSFPSKAECDVAMKCIEKAVWNSIKFVNTCS